MGVLHATATSGGPGEAIGAAVGATALGILGASVGGPFVGLAAGIIGGIVGGELGSLFDRLHAGELNPQGNLEVQLERLREQSAELEEFLKSPEIQEFDRLVNE